MHYTYYNIGKMKQTCFLMFLESRQRRCRLHHHWKLEDCSTFAVQPQRKYDHLELFEFLVQTACWCKTSKLMEDRATIMMKPEI